MTEKIGNVKQIFYAWIFLMYKCLYSLFIFKTVNFIKITVKTILYFFAAILLLSACNKPELDIDAVDFKAGPCIIGCPIYEMKIAKNGEAIIDAVAYNKIGDGRFKATIEKSKIDSLNTLISEADFFRLSNKYSVTITDQALYTLTVRLKNRQQKTIVDYGAGGPEKLKKVYHFLFLLSQSEHWSRSQSN